MYSNMGEEVGSLGGPHQGVYLKFNVNGAARGKPGPTGVGGVLRDHKEDVLLIFSNNEGLQESNEIKVLAILEALRLLFSSFHEQLLVESDFSNAISWISSKEGPWKFHFLFLEIKYWSFQGLVGLKYMGRSANIVADSLGKQGVGRFVPLTAYTI